MYKKERLDSNCNCNWFTQGNPSKSRNYVVGCRERKKLPLTSPLHCRRDKGFTKWQMFYSQEISCIQPNEKLLTRFCENVKKPKNNLILSIAPLQRSINPTFVQTHHEMLSTHIHKNTQNKRFLENLGSCDRVCRAESRNPAKIVIQEKVSPRKNIKCLVNNFLFWKHE